MKLKNKYILAGITLFTLALPISVFAIEVTPTVYEDTSSGSDSVYFNPIIGLSPFVGVIGFEIQKEHHSLGVGIPGNISYRYYFNPNKNTKFWGVYYGEFDVEDNDERVDGVFFRDFETAFVGMGIGYRWLWHSGWNVNASISIQYYDDEYSNPGSAMKATERGVMLFPGINAGYRF